MSTVLLELKGIKKYFPIKRGILRNTVGFVKAVDCVNLKINEGEDLGLVGESGCGKTTLARIILRLIKPDSGRIIFRGDDIGSYLISGLRNFRKDVQIVFQDPFSSLDPRFKIKDTIGEGISLWGEKDRGKILKRVEEIIASVGLSENSLNRLPHEFSGGERQRIAIARALFTNPKLLVLDEAVSSLDVLIQNQILKLLLELRKKFNLTYIFIAHNLRVIKKISQKVAVMYLGKIVELAETEEFFSNAVHPYAKLLLDAAINFRVDVAYDETAVSDKNCCCYYNRCIYRQEICFNKEPAFKEIIPGHFVACHLPGIDNFKKEQR
jgi:oligopeptide/dipeptide ABC transporter ATP-binding protein